MTRELTDARVLVVDDEPRNVLLLERILQREGFSRVRSTTDSREVLPLFASFDPDILLLDLHMPHVDGFEVLRRVRGELGEDGFVPTVVLTADASTNARDLALTIGAQDFLTKPLDAKEVVLRIRNLLGTRMLHLRLMQDATHQRAATERARIEVLDRLARAVDLRDNETFNHTQRVGDMSAHIGALLGLPMAERELLRQAGPLHDIGKIGISDSVLLKPGRLTDAEFEHVKTHTTIGADLLAGSEIPVLRAAQAIARSHHERWDGRGYPDGLAGEAIPVHARIVAVADVFDALSHERPYKEAWPLEQVLDEFRKERGAHFDPAVVDALFDVVSLHPRA
jgi:putative two-component system response regulator